MAERDGYIPGVPCWVDTSQRDPDAAAAFYGGLFGWEVEDIMPPGSPGKYLVARLRGGDVAAISTPPQGATDPAVWNTYVWVDSADETTARVREAGGAVLMEPFDVFDAGRMAVLSDSEGTVFSVWQAKDHRGARIVNEAGALTFNSLNTRDLKGASSFYGSVFGWETFDLPGGKAWALPGYGDYLEQLTPGMRPHRRVRRSWFRGRGRRDQHDPRWRHRHPGPLERHLQHRRRDATPREPPTSAPRTSSRPATVRSCE